VFLALAAGIDPLRRTRAGQTSTAVASKALIAWLVLAGLFLGFATEFVVEAAGV
jgi:hypothetical protein